MLRNNPAFTTVAVLTLALGIGANTAIFTLVNALLLKMLPIKDPARLVALGDPTQVDRRSHGTPQADIFSYPLYSELRDRTTVFSGMYAAGTVHAIKIQTSGHSTAESGNVSGRVVTGNYFPVLGADALIGRTILPDDDKVQHGGAVAVISYNFWKREFAQSPSVLGQTVSLNNYPFTIVSVTRPGFFGDVVGENMDLFVPMSMQAELMPGRDWYKDKKASWLQIMARLKPGVSLQQARAEINLRFKQVLKGSFGAALEPEDLKAIEKNDIQVVPGGRGLSDIRHAYQTPLFVLMAIVGLVLLIACVNVANLLLARASARNREIAVRVAIGASPRHIIRQLLTESLLLAFLGGAVGAVLAIWGVDLLVKIVGADLTATVDARVLAFTAAVCVLTGILFGLVPALRSVRGNLAPALKQVSTAGTQARTRWHWGKGLVTAQVALSLLVLFAAGLLVSSLRNLRNMDTGYGRDHLLIVPVDAIGAGYSATQTHTIAQQLRDRLAATPGVRAVTFSENGLFSGTESDDDIVIPGFTPPRDEDKTAARDEIGPNYFSTLGIPLTLGREIGPQDTTSSPRVAVINQSMADFYFHGQNPIGRKFFIEGAKDRDKPIEIVGVVRDAKQNDINKPEQRRFYTSLLQLTDRTPNLRLEVQAIGDPAAIAGNLRKQVEATGPKLTIRQVHTLKKLIDTTLEEPIVLAELSSFFAALALLLACVGLYGVMSYTVSGRTREIGLRMALGAASGDVLWLVLGEALLLVGTGIAVGIPAALACSRLLSSMLFGLSASDPVALAIVVAALGAVAVFASYIPARRAAKVDPMVALRYE